MTDFRAKLQDLLDAAENHVSPYRGHEDAWDAAFDRASKALAKPEREGPTDEELNAICDGTPWRGSPLHFGREVARAVLARWGNHRGILGSSPQPPSGEVRYDFAVYDAETGEPQAGGEAPTLEAAQREGQHYFAMYSEDGPMRLELRRVEVLPFNALPLPSGDA